MGIRFSCPNGHKLNVKVSLAGKRGICPDCGAKIQIPDAAESPATAVAPVPMATTTASAGGFESSHTALESASPSIVIALAESSAVKSNEVASAPVAVTPPVPTPPSPAPTIPDSIVIPRQPPMVKPAEPLPPDVQYQMRRERSRRNQVRIAVALILMVIALGIALVCVLWRNATIAPNGQSPTETTGQTHHLRSIAGAAAHESYHAHFWS